MSVINLQARLSADSGMDMAEPLAPGGRRTSLAARVRRGSQDLSADLAEFYPQHAAGRERRASLAPSMGSQDSDFSEPSELKESVSKKDKAGLLSGPRNNKGWFGSDSWSVLKE